MKIKSVKVCPITLWRLLKFKTIKNIPSRNAVMVKPGGRVVHSHDETLRYGVQSRDSSIHKIALQDNPTTKLSGAMCIMLGWVADSCSQSHRSVANSQKCAELVILKS